MIRSISSRPFRPKPIRLPTIQWAVVLFPLVVVTPAHAQEPGGDDLPGKPADDVALGNEFRHLWPLDRPVYVNREGKVVLQVEGDDGDNFSEGLAGVKVGDRWGFVDPRGKWVITPRFHRVGGFSEGLVAVKIGDKWGYADRSGTIVIEPQFTTAGPFLDGISRVNTGQPFTHYGRNEFKYGFIDKRGEWIIPPYWPWANDFSEGLARVQNGLMDRTGRRVLDLTDFDNAGPRISEGLIDVRKDGLAGYMDRHGAWKIKPQFAAGQPFSEGMAAVRPATLSDMENGVYKVSHEKDRCYGYIDHSGKVVIPPKFVYAKPFQCGLARVSVAEPEGFREPILWGFIDRTGKMVIPPVYNDARDFARGLTWVHQGGKRIIMSHYYGPWEGGQWYLMDTQGKVVWEEKQE